MRKFLLTTSIVLTLLLGVFVAPSAKAWEIVSCNGGSYYVEQGVAGYGYGCTGELNFDSTVTSIAQDAFANPWWSGIDNVSNAPTTVNFPNSVITIGRNAFYLVFSITNLTFGNSVETIGDYSFEGANPPSLVLPDSLKYIGNFSMKHMFRVTSLVIPNKVTFIGEDAFDRSPLTTLTLGRSVTTIGPGAFRHSALTCLTNLPNIPVATLVASGITNAADLPSCIPAFRSVGISGAIRVGQSLTATPITTGIVSNTTYQWQRSEKSNSGFVNISGANSASYQLVSKDSEKFIRVNVTVTDGINSVTANSAVTTRVPESSKEGSKEKEKEKEKEKKK